MSNQNRKHGVKSILYELMLKMLRDLKMADPETGLLDIRLMASLISTYYRVNPVASTNIAPNLLKQISTGTLTWLLFNRVLEVINVRKYSIRIELTHKNGRRTVHEIKDIEFLKGESLDETDEPNDGKTDGL